MNLFDGLDILYRIDAEVAQHPEWLRDPIKMEAVGLTFEAEHRRGP